MSRSPITNATSVTGDGHDRRVVTLFRLALCSRCTAMLAGLRTLIHAEYWPDR
jgi:hypothetical protein